MLVEASTPNAQGTLTVTLNRPPVNALNAEMQNELTRIFKDAAANPKIQRVVLQQGKGCKNFCGGVDIEEMREEMQLAMNALQPEANLAPSLHYAEMLDAVASFPKPIISVVKGAAVGAGATLVALSDYVIAAQGARFRYPEKYMHLKPSISAPYVAARMGAAKALQHFSSGDFFYADVEEKKNGASCLVDRVCPEVLLPVVAAKLIEDFGSGKMIAKRAPIITSPVVRGDGEMEQMLREAMALYADRSDEGRRVLIEKTAENLAKDRAKQEAFEELSRYCQRLHVSSPSTPGANNLTR